MIAWSGCILGDNVFLKADDFNSQARYLESLNIKNLNKII